MKNLTVRSLGFVILSLIFGSFLFFSNNNHVYAQYDSTVSTQTQGTITNTEIELNNLQKRLIVLLNVRLSMLQAEWKAVAEQRIRNLQIELVGLLQKQVALLQAQVMAGK